MSCKYCGTEENKNIVEANVEYMPRYSVYISPKTLKMVITSGSGDNRNSKRINYCPMCGRCLKQRLTPAQENAYKGSPRDSSHKPIYGVVDTPKNAVQPVFHIGDTIRFKSTGTIEKVHYITHGGRFINSVDVNDVEKL